jgi:predicted Zn finger-like uncharacterized protein
MIKSFTCPSCGNSFDLPVEKISPQGSRGKCKSCGNVLMVFQDGRANLAEPVPPAPQVSPQKQDDPPIWQLRLKATQITLKTGPFRLGDIGDMILEGKLVPEDEAMVQGGGWLPLKAYSAMDGYWAVKTLQEREKFGDQDHCVKHQNIESKWTCPKCLKFFCHECAVNKPFITGGKENYVCPDDEMELAPLKKKSQGLSSLLGLKPKK